MANPNEQSIDKMFFIDRETSTFIHVKEDDVYFTGEITDASCHYLSMFLINIDRERKNSINQILNLHMNTVGGDLIDSLRLYDLIKTLNVTMHCYVEGLVASGGVLVMCGCYKIYCTENSSIMLHEYNAEMDGKASELKIYEKFNEQLYDKCMCIYKERTGHSKITKQWLKEDRYLSASEALDLKLIDEIVYNKKIQQSKSKKENTK